MHVPALFLALPLLAGSAGAVFWFDSLGSQFAFLTASAALIAWIAGVAAAIQDDRIEASVAIALSSLLAGLSLGAVAAKQAYAPPLLQWFAESAGRETVVVEGVLREDASPTPFGLSLTLDVRSVASPGAGLVCPSMWMGGVRLSVGGTLSGPMAGEWRAGRTVRAPAVLRLPSVYLNPGSGDDRRSLARRGVVLVGTIKSAALVEVVGRGSIVAEAAGSIRAAVRARVSRHVGALDRKAAGVTTAVLIGDRSGLSAQDERRLQEAGTYHVIAISGGNIALLAVVAMLACRLLLIPSRVSAVLTACGLCFYGAIASSGASVSRAITVAAVMLAARALDQRGSSLNALAVAAASGVALSPVAVFDAGFLLSFGATIGILLGVPRLVAVTAPRQPRAAGAAAVTSTDWRALTRRIGSSAALLCAATVCAEIALAPVGATFFSRVSLAGVLLNLAAIPLMTVVQIGGLVVAVFAGWADPLARLGAVVAHGAATGLLQSARLVDAAPWLAIDVRPPAWWVIASYYLSLALLWHARTRRVAAGMFVAAASAMLSGSHLTARDAVPPARVPLRAVVLDVGQGDATVLSLPGGRSVLVDAGGLATLPSTPTEADDPGFDVGERVVIPALRALGITRLGTLAITHGDPDHLLGARGVLRHVPAHGIWEGVPVPPHAGLQALAAVARAGSIPWRTVQAGDRERIGDVEVRVLHPPIPEWERQRVRNEDSVVLEVRLGRVSIILPGDIGKEGEHAILPRLEPGRLVILKAPHHGSATSSTKALLDALRPAAVIFSCGRDNRFGHPHPSVVERYQAMGTAIFSTAADGAVFVETDGVSVEVRGWRGRRAKFGGSHPR